MTLEPDPLELDLGVLRPWRGATDLSFYAPSAPTRAVWLAGTAACGVYLYSVVLTFGWSTRLPTLAETPFWLLPLALGALFAALALGGVRLAFRAGELELAGFWPQRSRRAFPWGDLQGLRFLTSRPAAANSSTACGSASRRPKSPSAPPTGRCGSFCSGAWRTGRIR